MPALDLWNLASQLKTTDYRWVDLTHTLSCDTPHWFGFKPFESTKLFDYLPGTPEDMLAPMRCFQYSVASQYGTHVDAPRHFHVDGRSLGEIEPIEFMHPLCVIDKHEECAANPDFILTVDDLKAWENEHGRIPEDAFVAFRSDWSKLADLENKDEDGQPRYPGWDLDAIKWLVEERNIGAIGHEPADTDPASVTTREDAYPYPGEQYILLGRPLPDRGHGPSGRASRHRRPHLLHLPQGARWRWIPRARFCGLPRSVASRQTFLFYNSRSAHPPITLAAYNPSGAPYVGAFYMGR